MAKIVGIAGTSHSPIVGVRPDPMWRFRAEADQENTELYDVDGQIRSYDELEQRAEGRFDDQLTMDVWNFKFDRAQEYIARLRSDLIALEPDIMVVVGDDQDELFTARNQPAIAVYHGMELETHGPDQSDPRRAQAQLSLGMDGQVYRAAPEAGLHVITSLVAAGFDIASSSETEKEAGFGHAFAWITGRVMKGVDIPTLPLLLNTYFPPNQPLPSRCYDLGVALRRAVESMPTDERVVVIASGGLSHFVVDEELDKKVLRAMEEGDSETLRSLDPALLNSGNSEIRNWIAAAGAGAHLRPDWIEYIPGYRSAAGTGVGLAFGIWS